MASSRLRQTTSQMHQDTNSVQDPNSIPWNPDNAFFPTRRNLPKHIPYHEEAPEDAAWVWGENDNIGRLNLLTPRRVASAARNQIITGETVRLDLPLDVPSTPAFGRERFSHRVTDLGQGLIFDDVYEKLNPQAGSQWDGFRHFSHLKSGKFYNGATASDILHPTSAAHKCSIHHWSSSPSSSSAIPVQRAGISGRAVLLDYYGYSQRTPGKAYDPYTGHAISFADLQACGAAQGLNILPASQGGDIQVGDILLIRSGFVEKYHSLTEEERHAAAIRKVHLFDPSVSLPASLDAAAAAEAAEKEKEKEKGSNEPMLEWAGLKQEPAILDWLHDSYFSAVAGDAPSFERWPTQAAYLLHEYILALWGMPLGEMWDLERVTEMCREKGRWVFFVSSAPVMAHGGVGSHPNATAIF